MSFVKSDVPTRKGFSDRMVEYGKIDKEFAVFEADIGYSTYTYLFGEAFPDRYFNMGIAEMGMVSAAAGMATGGRTVVASSYGVFITMRAVEAIRSFICYPNLNVKFLSSHGGLTAAIDGATHQATEDIAFMTTLPNMKVLVPADAASAGKLFDVTMKTPGPVFVRLMRDGLFDLYGKDETFTMGGSKVLREGGDVTIVTYGDIVFQALQAADALARKGIQAEVIDMYSIKPFDAQTLLSSIKKTGKLLVVENHQARNGLAYELAHFCLVNNPVAFANLGIADSFGESGDYFKVIDKYGLSDRCIVDKAVELIGKK